MKEKKQNLIGGIILIALIIILVSYWLIINSDDSNSENDIVILTPLEVAADPAAYIGNEIRVEGVVITNEPETFSFLMMPIDIYVQCGRDAFCGEEYTHLTVDCESYLSDKSLPPIEQGVIVTGNIERISDDTFVLVATKIKDNGRV